ncbi:MAG: hypothetical protein ACLQRH_25485 [Acidimicrobiales bacterium]
MEDDADVDEPAQVTVPTARRQRPPIRSQRTLQVILGLLWIFDAALQFQPFMFSRGFVNTYLLANASGQPAVIHWVITNVGNFLAPHVDVWNSLFALTQLAIGLGLLYRPTVRVALAISFPYALGVWVFGEGLGFVLSGSASALTGAPGSVLMYGLIGLMAWPRTRATAVDGREGIDKGVGVASSAAAQGIGGAITPLAVWSGFWALAAVLFLLPDNRTRTSISSAITGMSSGEPGAYSHFLTHFGNHFGSVGTTGAWLLATASLVIGIGPLVARRPGGFLFAGGLLAALFWVSGQGLGGVLTGSGTDPNTGPLVILLALAMVPNAAAEPSASRTPMSTLLRRNPGLALGGGAVLVLVLVLSAAYPAPAQESTGMAMSGMSMSGMTPSSDTATTASCTAGNSGVARAGLDLTNTPYMIMGGTAGMNMNGADATAAAGLNTTKANWSYTGPALPTDMAQELLADGNNGPDEIHMALTGCAAQPTFSQQINANQFVQSTSQAVARYDDPAAAEAAGYVAVSPVSYPVTYYVNPAIAAANAAARRTLDPAYVDGLVYATTPDGQQVLAAAMYVLPSTVHIPPMPFGALVQWHKRTAVCGPVDGSATTLAITGTPPCTGNTVQRPTPYLTMVWQIPVAGGPTAIQPPDIQIVEAAVMQVATSG